MAEPESYVPQGPPEIITVFRTVGSQILDRPPEETTESVASAERQPAPEGVQAEQDQNKTLLAPEILVLKNHMLTLCSGEMYPGRTVDQETLGPCLPILIDLHVWVQAGVLVALTAAGTVPVDGIWLYQRINAMLESASPKRIRRYLKWARRFEEYKRTSHGENPRKRSFR